MSPQFLIFAFLARWHLGAESSTGGRTLERQLGWGRFGQAARNSLGLIQRGEGCLLGHMGEGEISVVTEGGALEGLGTDGVKETSERVGMVERRMEGCCVVEGEVLEAKTVANF